MSRYYKDILAAIQNLLPTLSARLMMMPLYIKMG